MSRSIWPLAATLGCVLALGACSSSRFGSVGPAPVQAAVPLPAYPDPVEPVPSGPMMAEPLPPLDGAGPYGSDPAAGGSGFGTDVAALPPQPEPVIPPAAPVVTPPSGRSALVGTWTARDGSGATCRVQLSSSPALDLYRASAGNCSNRDLARVTAWDYRDGEIYLYQPGGTVAARLRGGGRSLDGVMAKSGAPLALSK